jgi:hypothetical protein
MNQNVFTDVTAQTKLPTPVVNGNYVAGWAADIEADGDLDVVLGSQQGQVTVLRNNGDDSFLAVQPFNGISGAIGFAWADLDADGDPDAALIDGVGKLHVFSNERQGQFQERALPSTLQSVRTINVADINMDGVLESCVVDTTGALFASRITMRVVTGKQRKLHALIQPGVLQSSCVYGLPIWITMAAWILILASSTTDGMTFRRTSLAKQG